MINLQKKSMSLLVALSLATAVSAVAQTAKVTIQPTTQRYLGDESEFARKKFVAFHAMFNNQDAEFERFKSDYNVDSDYTGSRSFYYPIAKAKNGVIPKVANKYKGKREVVDYVATTSPGALFKKGVDYTQTDFMPYIKKVSAYVAESYAKEWDKVPMYLEPFNEPMVHAADFAVGKTWNDKKPGIEAVIEYICQYHKEIARAVKSKSELKDVQIMGFGSAFPEFESNNFKTWNDRFKKFIDIAGDDIDIMSLHLYDGSGINNAGGRRTGSNLEAILDMVQTYTYIKQGKPMPMAITEYGRLVPNQPEWEKATGAKGNQLDKPVTTKISNYNPVTNSQAVRSQLQMVMSFMNRQNELINTIPFTIGKSPQSAMYSKSSLWVKDDNGGFDYSNRKYFFEMLKDIEGDQVVVNSDNVDVPALGYVDDEKLYVMLNNLNDSAQTVSLDLVGGADLKKVSVKSLKIFEDKEPELKITKLKEAPKSITLDYGQCVVLTYEFKKDVDFTKEVVREKFYSKKYLQPIKAGEAMSFTIDKVKVNDAQSAVLRLGVGRKHGLTVEPAVVKINGTQVALAKDVIKGYDQHNRKEFFGALEIPFDVSLLKKGSNMVEVQYTQDGGNVTTAILQVENVK